MVRRIIWCAANRCTAKFIIIIIIIAIFKEGAQLAKAVFSGALKINNKIKIISVCLEDFSVALI